MAEMWTRTPIMQGKVEQDQVKPMIKKIEKFLSDKKIHKNLLAGKNSKIMRWNQYRFLAWCRTVRPIQQTCISKYQERIRI